MVHIAALDQHEGQHLSRLFTLILNDSLRLEGCGLHNDFGPTPKSRVAKLVAPS